MRNEQDIFDDLALLCSSPGYVHALSFLCFRDSIVAYAGEMKAKDMVNLYSKSRLIRTEIMTLVGLMIKSPVDYTLPASHIVQEYITKTEALLEELHQSMNAIVASRMTPEKIAAGYNPFAEGETLREPIFYGGESAYDFQYRDLSQRKYAYDDEWLKSNKGFSIQAARDVVRAIEDILNKDLISTLKTFHETSVEERTLLPGFTFSLSEVAKRAGVDSNTAAKVLVAFTVSSEERNGNFSAIHDFNIVNATPLLRKGNDEYILFQWYSLVEALYESPYYWMSSDSNYTNIAAENRGRFTEELSRERLERVFGKGRVYSNVEIIKSKSEKSGEIDVLVIFGNRLIILQAKSKKLTLEARRGNDGQIRADFKKAIQDAYDQGYKCASLVFDSDCTLIDANSKKVKLPANIKEVIIFCVVSDHYPALSFQTRQFLKYEFTEKILPPFIMDVFTLDAIIEMLETPLRFLSYAHQRSRYYDSVYSSHELTILSYHLKRNLWLGKQVDFLMLEDDIGADLDVAMAVRRNGVQGKRTPDGILTRLVDTSLGKMISEIEDKPSPGTIDLGFMLLTLSEDTVKSISKNIDTIAELARKNGGSHDVTISIGGGRTGLTIHCNEYPNIVAAPKLRSHCEMRKYTEKAETWFGVCIHPAGAKLRFGINLDYRWERSSSMEARTRRLPRPSKSGIISAADRKKMQKIGRNDPCPCGSGLKYKKCHGR